MAKAKLLGTGLYAPGEPIGNEELKSLAGIEFDSAKTEARIGIKARHVARLRGLDETTADFAERAARAALADAGVDAGDVGLFIVATDTPEYVSPATAILLQGRLQGGETESEAYDLGASCASFVTALDAAARALATDKSLRHALVVGVYNMPAHVRPGDAFGFSIFADGTRKPVTRELLDAGTWGLELLQRLPGDRNVKLWPPLVRRLLEKAGLALEDVDHFVFTQINRSVIEEVMGLLGRPMSDTTCVMDRYGYTGSGCVPMALHHALKEGRVRKGDKVVLVASGAGFAVGANLLVI